MWKHLREKKRRSKNARMRGMHHFCGTSDCISRHEITSTPHCTFWVWALYYCINSWWGPCQEGWQSKQLQGRPRPRPLCGERLQRTMVLPLLLKLLNVFLRQYTFTEAPAAHLCCPAALMPRPPSLSLSCHREWGAKEHPQRLTEGREVRQAGTSQMTGTDFYPWETLPQQEFVLIIISIFRHSIEILCPEIWPLYFYHLQVFIFSFSSENGLKCWPLELKLLCFHNNKKVIYNI